jgi:hypothetical protein
MVYPQGKKPFKRTPFLSQKTLAMIFATEHVCLNFRGFFVREWA